MFLSTQAVELCTLLVDETYGELTSRIFTILLRRGRLPIPLLCRHTGLGARKIRHGLVVLLQQNLAYFTLDEDTGTTYYEANPDAAYSLIRSGKIMDMVESRYGTAARDVVQNLFLLGHTKVADLTEAYESKQEQKTNGNGHSANGGANGQSKYSVTSTTQLHSILARLLQVGFVETVSKAMFQSPTDTENRLERKLLQNDFNGGTKGTKQKEDLRLKIRRRLRELRDERTWKPANGKKRPINGELANGSNKRRRLANGSGAVNGDHSFEDDGPRIDPDLVIRINFEKCTVVLRYQRFVEHARERVGVTTSQIYAEALKLMEEKIPRCRPDPKVDEPKEPKAIPSPIITTMELAAAIGKSIDVSAGIGKVKSGDPGALMKSPKSKKRSVGEVNDTLDEGEPDEDSRITNGNKDKDVAMADGDGDPFTDDVFASPKRQRVTFQEQPPDAAADRGNSMLQVKNHLRLLADDECPFIQDCGTRGLGEWAIDFERVVSHIQEAELDTMVLENFGPSGHRLVRMLRKLGKLDEKSLPTMALLSQKGVRTKLAEMQMAGVVDIQEVPRDAGHTNQRTIFLWYFDTERVSTNLLNNFYKAMSRCLQRLEIEKRRAHEALAPTLRSDTQGQLPEEYLEGSQLRDYQRIIGKEEALLGELGRLDDLVGTFRDF